MNNNLQDFIEVLIKQTGLDKMPVEFLDEYKNRLQIEAEKRLGLAAMAELSTKQIEEFNKLAAKTENDPAKINDYLASHIDNFESKMTEALKQFGQEVIVAAKKVA